MIACTSCNKVSIIQHLIMYITLIFLMHNFSVSLCVCFLEGNNQEDEQELDVDNPDAMPIEDTVEMRQCGSCFYYFTSKGGQYLNLVI